MDEKKIYATLQIRKRPWYAWLLRFLWLVWIIFWAEVSIGSWKETEPRAFAIAVVILAVSFLTGVLIWLRGYLKSRRQDS
jgi:hypothetical protein